MVNLHISSKLDDLIFLDMDEFINPKVFEI